MTRTSLLAAVTATLTFTLMIVGSVVHGAGASLACPDWPLCHGTAFPSMTGGVELEHSHRLVALAVATLTALLFARTRRAGSPRARRLAATALALVVVQASLGAATVLLRLPPVVSIAHLATSMAVLSTLVLLAVESRAAPERAASATGDAASLRPWLALAALAAFAQIVAGAVVRHTHAALACGGLPTCDGALWPDGWLARVHMAHRAGAVLVAAVVVAAAMRLRARAPRSSWLRGAALVPCAIVAAQIALGAAVVLSFAPLWVVTLHHATGALLLASLVTLAASAPSAGRASPRVAA